MITSRNYFACLVLIYFLCHVINLLFAYFSLSYCQICLFVLLIPSAYYPFQRFEWQHDHRAARFVVLRVFQTRHTVSKPFHSIPLLSLTGKSLFLWEILHWIDSFKQTTIFESVSWSFVWKENSPIFVNNYPIRFCDLVYISTPEIGGSVCSIFISGKHFIVLRHFFSQYFLSSALKIYISGYLAAHWREMR